jgi:hypothetical protein
MKLIKFLDYNYNESATNFANSTRIELIDEDQYYQTYEDVFGPETAAGDKNLFNDYGQKWDRQSLRKDFNPKLTKKYVPIYNERGLQ